MNQTELEYWRDGLPLSERLNRLKEAIITLEEPFRNRLLALFEETLKKAQAGDFDAEQDR